MAPFIILIDSILQIYVFCIIAWAILSTLISFKVVNAYQPVVQKVMYALDRLCEPALKRIRKILPDLGGIDVSPIILFLLLEFLRNALRTYL